MIKTLKFVSKAWGFIKFAKAVIAGFEAFYQELEKQNIKPDETV